MPTASVARRRWRSGSSIARSRSRTLIRSPGAQPDLRLGRRAAGSGDALKTSSRSARSSATSAVMSFVVEAIWRRWSALRAKRMSPVVASMRIAALARRRAAARRGGAAASGRARRRPRASASTAPSSASGRSRHGASLSVWPGCSELGSTLGLSSSSCSAVMPGARRSTRRVAGLDLDRRFPAFARRRLASSSAWPRPCSASSPSAPGVDRAGGLVRSRRSLTSDQEGAERRAAPAAPAGRSAEDRSPASCAAASGRGSRPRLSATTRPPADARPRRAPRRPGRRRRSLVRGGDRARRADEAARPARARRPGRGPRRARPARRCPEAGTARAA